MTWTVHPRESGAREELPNPGAVPRVDGEAAEPLEGFAADQDVRLTEGVLEGSGSGRAPEEEHPIPRRSLAGAGAARVGERGHQVGPRRAGHGDVGLERAGMAALIGAREEEEGFFGFRRGAVAGAAQRVDLGREHDLVVRVLLGPERREAARELVVAGTAGHADADRGLPARVVGRKRALTVPCRCAGLRHELVPRHPADFVVAEGDGGLRRSSSRVERFADGGLEGLGRGREGDAVTVLGCDELGDAADLRREERDPGAEALQHGVRGVLHEGGNDREASRLPKVVHGFRLSHLRDDAGLHMARPRARARREEVLAVAAAHLGRTPQEGDLDSFVAGPVEAAHRLHEQLEPLPRLETAEEDELVDRDGSRVARALTAASGGGQEVLLDESVGRERPPLLRHPLEHVAARAHDHVGQLDALAFERVHRQIRNSVEVLRVGLADPEDGAVGPDAEGRIRKGEALALREHAVEAGSGQFREVDDVEPLLLPQPGERAVRQGGFVRAVEPHGVEGGERHEANALGRVVLDPLGQRPGLAIVAAEEEEGDVVSGEGEGFRERRIGGSDPAVAKRPVDLGRREAVAPSGPRAGLCATRKSREANVGLVHREAIPARSMPRLRAPRGGAGRRTPGPKVRLPRGQKLPPHCRKSIS